MASEPCLIVEQIPAPFVELPELLRALSRQHQLDSYNSRQRLLGSSQALFAHGPAEKIARIQKLLGEHDIDSHLLTPTQPRFAPFFLTRIETDADELRLVGREKQLRIPKGAKLLLCLADLSGNLIERSLGQLLSAQRYRGQADNQLAEKKKIRLILQGRPALDIYLLDDTGIPLGATRALPRKFDHRGLGDRATLSAVQNLFKLAELTSEYAAESRLDLNFGLSRLPGADLRKADEGDLEGFKKNLRNLTRYAWLQTDIDRTRTAQPFPEKDDLSTATTAFLGVTRPDLAATSLPLTEQLTETISPETRDATSEHHSRRTPLQSVADLPPPPPIRHHRLWTHPKAIIGFSFAGLVILFSSLEPISNRLGPLLQKGIESGLFSGLFALGLFTFAIRRLQLKRRIENTPTSKIRSLAMGMVEVKGFARRQYALVSPMSNIACIFYRLTRFKRNNKGQWVVSNVISSGQTPFWIEDETGRVSVDPTNARIKAAHRQESSVNGASLGSFSSAREKWVEELIYDGAKIYVLGEAQVKKQEGGNKTKRRAAALRELKQNKNRLAAFDNNADGRLDEAEWQAARDAIDAQLLSEDLAASEQHRRQEDLVVIAKPRQRGLPLVIAETASETHLTSGYGLSASVMLVAAGLCTILALWQLLH